MIDKDLVLEVLEKELEFCNNHQDFEGKDWFIKGIQQCIGLVDLIEEE